MRPTSETTVLNRSSALDVKAEATLSQHAEEIHAMINARVNIRRESVIR